MLAILATLPCLIDPSRQPSADVIALARRSRLLPALSGVQHADSGGRRLAGIGEGASVTAAHGPEDPRADAWPDRTHADRPADVAHPRCYLAVLTGAAARAPQAAAPLGGRGVAGRREHEQAGRRGEPDRTGLQVHG